jgi:hypothetical protein
VLSTLYGTEPNQGQAYGHFCSLVDDFYQASHIFKVASVNNHALDLEKLGSNIRISRFIRDPRDLVVSGYFYHRRGAEDWCNIVDPEEKDWKVVNGYLPERMVKGYSFSSYLQSLSEEDGLIAEIDFRTNHFRSMMEWPTTDARIKLFRYEDIIGKEWITFLKMFSFYGVPWRERIVGSTLARRFSATKQIGTFQHIRNPKAGQWKKHFTPKVRSYFERRYSELLEFYGYE